MKYAIEHVKDIKPYKPGEQPKDGEYRVKLNTNENPYPPSKSVLKMIENFDFDSLRLYPDPTAEVLCGTIANKFFLKRENIIATNGSDEAFTYIFNAFVSNEKTVVLTNPTYTVYEALAERFNIEFSVLEAEDDFSINLDKVPNKKNTVFFLANPNAQTGLYIDDEKIEDFIKSFKGLLIVDEAYVDFAPKSVISLVEKYDNLIVTRTFSKSYSLCGIRLGFAASNKDNIDALYRVKDSYNINTLTQSIGIEVVKDDKTMFENADKIISERERMRSELMKTGYASLPSKANFLLVKPLFVDAKLLFQELRKNHLYVRYFETERLKDYLRITIGNVKENNVVLYALSALSKNEKLMADT